jgi:hypothetical protein
MARRLIDNDFTTCHLFDKQKTAFLFNDAGNGCVGCPAH